MIFYLNTDKVMQIFLKLFYIPFSDKGELKIGGPRQMSTLHMG